MVPALQHLQPGNKRLPERQLIQPNKTVQATRMTK
jgi:hypothetical protein